jgi:hypothetical protein
MKDYKNFLKKFMNSWKNLEGEKTCEFFADKLQYFENPIDPPLTSKEKVFPLWSIVRENQKDISYKGNILFEDEKSCIYHSKMQRTMVKTNKVQKIDGIFEIKLNSKNLLAYFKQWRYTEEE